MKPPMTCQAAFGDVSGVTGGAVCINSEETHLAVAPHFIPNDTHECKKAIGAWTVRRWLSPKRARACWCGNKDLAAHFAAERRQ